MRSNLAYATICLGIIVLNDNIGHGADSQMIRDLRLDEEIFKKMIGKQFNKYRCDPFVFTNSVTGIVGLYIGNQIYELKNEQTKFQYFDSINDVALWNIKEVKDSDIHSFFEDAKQINTPVNQKIEKITLINEKQVACIDNLNYSLLVTRAIVFHLENRDIYFEKDNTAFSEEIEIKRGHDLLSEFPKRNDYFLDQWIEGIKSDVQTEFIEIQ